MFSIGTMIWQIIAFAVVISVVFLLVRLLIKKRRG